MPSERAVGGPSAATAFLLVVDKHAGTAAPRAPSPMMGVAQLGFEGRHELHWADAAGAVRLTGWSDQPGAWVQCGGDVAVVTGDLRRRGHRGDQTALLTQLMAQGGVERARDELRGVFAAAVITAQGDGVVFSDPIGHRCLYEGENDHVLVMSSRAAVAAAALAPAGRPTRDALGVCWLPFTTYRVGERSGFEGVRVIRPGATLRLAGGQAVWEHTDPFDVARRGGLELPIDELAEAVLDDVGDALRSLLARPSPRHVLSLTGGKDSRVVLAAALRAGVAEDLRYETVGPPDLPDVQIASELSALFGLRHDVRFAELQNAEPFGDRFRRFVELTAGMVSGWVLQGSTTTGDLHLTGLCGELLRSCTRLPKAAGSPPPSVEAFLLSRVGRLALVRPAVAEQLQSELLDHLSSEPRPEADPLDRAQAHFASSRMRFARLGAREELFGDRRVHPLYSPLGLRAALSLDAHDRQSEVLVGWMLRLGSERLVHHRFTDSGWDERARHSLGIEPTPAPAVGRRAPAPVPPPAAPLMASLHAVSGDRRALLAEVFADAQNPAWDLLDRTAAVDALSRYGRLSTHERQELFGAATAAVWLAG